MTYIFRYEGKVVFEFSLNSRYIFSIVDFVNYSISNLNGKTPNEIIKLLGGPQRTSSRSSNTEKLSHGSIYLIIRKLWESMGTYFPLVALEKDGFDLRSLDSNHKGLNELIYIVKTIESMFPDLVNVAVKKNINKVTGLSDPSFQCFGCTMSITFLPDADKDKRPLRKRRKPGRPRLYSNDAEKKRIYRIRKNRKEFMDSCDSIVDNDFIRDYLKEKCKHVHKPPDDYTNEICLDTDLVQVMIEEDRMLVRAVENIAKDVLITEYLGWLISWNPSVEEKKSPYFITIEGEVYEGIRYPMVLRGVGSLIKKGEDVDMCNVIFSKDKDGTIWAKSIKEILKGQEIVARDIETRVTTRSTRSTRSTRVSTRSTRVSTRSTRVTRNAT